MSIGDERRVLEVLCGSDLTRSARVDTHAVEASTAIRQIDQEHGDRARQRTHAHDVASQARESKHREHRHLVCDGWPWSWLGCSTTTLIPCARCTQYVLSIGSMTPMYSGRKAANSTTQGPRAIEIARTPSASDTRRHGTERPRRTGAISEHAQHEIIPRLAYSSVRQWRGTSEQEDPHQHLQVSDGQKTYRERECACSNQLPHAGSLRHRFDHPSSDRPAEIEEGVFQCVADERANKQMNSSAIDVVQSDIRRLREKMLIGSALSVTHMSDAARSSRCCFVAAAAAAAIVV